MKQGFLFILGLIALTDLCDTVSQLVLKSSINSLDIHVNSIRGIFKLIVMLIRVPRIWISLIFSTISLSVWLFVLSRSELNFAYSLDSMRYVMISLAALIFLKEKMSLGRWLGIICVVLGIMLVASG